MGRAVAPLTLARPPDSSCLSLSHKGDLTVPSAHYLAPVPQFSHLKTGDSNNLPRGGDWVSGRWPSSWEGTWCREPSPSEGHPPARACRVPRAEQERGSCLGLSLSLPLLSVAGPRLGSTQCHLALLVQSSPLGCSAWGPQGTAGETEA